MQKSELLQNILLRLEKQLRVMTSAAADTKKSATGAEAKSEGKYDTRAIEAAYLAGAQQEQAEHMAAAVQSFRNLALPDYELTDAIGPGALVEADQDGDTVFYLLAPAAGGMTLEHLGCELTILAPEAPLYQKLLGQKAGSLIDSPPLLLLGVE